MRANRRLARICGAQTLLSAGRLFLPLHYGGRPLDLTANCGLHERAVGERPIRGGSAEVVGFSARLKEAFL